MNSSKSNSTSVLKSNPTGGAGGGAAGTAAGVKRAVLGDVSNSTAVLGNGKVTASGPKGAKTTSTRQALRPSTTTTTHQTAAAANQSQIQKFQSQQKQSQLQQSKPKRKSLGGVQQQQVVVAPRAPAAVIAAERKTRSSVAAASKTGTAISSSKAGSSAAAVSSTADAATKRKSRTSRAAAASVIPPTATAPVDEEAMAPAVKSIKTASSKSTAPAIVSEAPVGAVTRRKSLIMANVNTNAKANKSATEKQQVGSAAAGEAVKPERRVSRKNSRDDDIEEQRIEARNHASKKARTLPHDDLDKEDAMDPMMVSEYVEEIFAYLQVLEVESLPNPSYMENQKELQWKMRSILVDWIIEVHLKFRLLPETLFLAVNIIDRFLSLRVVSLVKLQLVGVTALFIASKYEEVMSPSIQSFLYMAEDGYTESEIVRAERYMLQVLKFNMQYPTPLSFLRRSSKADSYDIQTRTLAKYLMEITLLDHRFLGIRASKIAAAAHYLARHMLDRGDWNKNLVYYSGYAKDELDQPVTFMLEFLSKPTKYEAIYKKYSQRKFMKGALFVKDWIVSRGSVGVHPVYEHAMNVEMRKEWIRRRKEQLEQSSSEVVDFDAAEDCSEEENVETSCGCGECHDSEEEEEQEEEEEGESEDSDSY